MQFFTFLLAALVSALAAAQNATFAQSLCSDAAQIHGGYTYSSSNPFPISTLAQPTGTPATELGGNAMATGTGSVNGSSPSSTAGITPYTGGASSNMNFEVMGALGCFGAFAIAAALL